VPVVEKRDVVVPFGDLPVPVRMDLPAPSSLDDEPHGYPGWPFPGGRVIQTHERCFLSDRNGSFFSLSLSLSRLYLVLL